MYQTPLKQIKNSLENKDEMQHYPDRACLIITGKDYTLELPS